MSIDRASGPVPVALLANNGWYAAGQALGVALDAPGTATITLGMSDGVDSLSSEIPVTWSVLDLTGYGLPQLHPRLGDRLAVTASGSGAQLTIIDELTGSTLGTGTPGQPVVIACDQPGPMSLSALIDDQPVGQLLPLSVRSAAIPAAPLAVDTGYLRRLQTTILPADTTAALVLDGGTAVYPDAAASSLADGLFSGAFTMTKHGVSSLLLRDQDDGRGLAMLPTVGFDLHTSASRLVYREEVYDDGSRRVRAQLQLTPFVPGLEVVARIVTEGVTFADGSLELRLMSDDFVQDRDSGTWVHPYRLIVPAGVNVATCHVIAVFQDGERVSAWLITKSLRMENET